MATCLVNNPIGFLILLSSRWNNVFSAPISPLLKHSLELLFSPVMMSGSAEAGQLARNYSHLKVVISGAAGTASEITALAGGIDRSRVLLETRSRNTYENALYSYELIRPKPGDRWLLVTSALHMPRSIGSFRKTGFEVEPWPVYEPSSREDRLNFALREWLGLIVYRILGRTGTFFPAHGVPLQ